jgi:hypothetical protein
MPTIYRLDADSTGTDSIQSYVDEHKIINIPCPTFKAFDIAAADLQDKVEPGDAVIFDTLTVLLDTTRGDMMHGDDPSKLLWNEHEKYYGDKQYLNTYKGSQNLTLRRVRNLVNRGVHGIIVCHTKEGKDQWDTLDKRAVPLVNPAMVDDLIGACSDVFMLEVLETDFYAGEKVAIPAGEHVLWLRRTAAHTAKFHVDPKRVDPKKIPDGIKDPTMEKLCGVLHKVPKCLCIYGHPGSGKSTLAAGIVEALTAKPTAKKKE